MIRYIQTGNNRAQHKKQFILFLFLGVLVLSIDSFTPIGVSDWIIYLLALLIYRKISENDLIIPLVLCYIFFIIVGIFISPRDTPLLYAVINRTAAIGVLIIIAYLSAREKAFKKVNAEIIERISDSFMALDPKGNVIYHNKTALDLSGKEQLLGKNLWKEIPVLENSVFRQKISEAYSKQTPLEFKLQSLLSPFLYNVSVYPSSRGVSIFSKNITEVEKAESRLRQMLKEKELLLMEIHHRVKNNFQLISSLIGLSMNKINDPQLLDSISVIQNRIRTLAVIHEKLYMSKSIDKIELGILINDLVNNFEQVHREKQNVKTEIITDDISLNIQNAIPLGSIINELLMNSLKHAFTDGQDGHIDISAKRIDGPTSGIELIYKDNGKGMPPDFDINKSETLGFTIITSFVDQLHGQMSFSGNGGAEFKFSLNI
jgi:PAS domain S-box-containing protein